MVEDLAGAFHNDVCDIRSNICPYCAEYKHCKAKLFTTFAFIVRFL